jgi:raffinose/stachyose/melibiose transport system substrate-binding protein
MKRVLVTLLALLLTAGLAFASGEKEGAQGESAEGGAQQEVTLNVFQFKPYLDEAYKSLADEFDAQHENVTTEIETKGGGTKWQTILKSKFAADEGPDVFPVEGPGQYEVWSDFIADLSGEPWIESAVPFALDSLNIDGQQMGMPVNLEGYGYIYNKDIFEEAGVEELPRTLSELQSAAQKIQDAGYTPFATGYATWWVMGLHMMNVPFAHQDNPEQFVEALNNGNASIAETEEFQDLKSLVDLTVEYGEDNPLTTDHNKQVQMFANGQVAMIQQGVWKEVPIQEANADINMGLLPMPLNNNESEMNVVPVGVPFYFAVNSQSSEAEQQAAKSFLNFLVGSETGQRYMTEEFGFIPAYKGVSSEGLGGVGKDILKYAGEDRTVPWVFGSFPDGFADDAAKQIQAYVADQRSWSEVLSNLDHAWQRRASE